MCWYIKSMVYKNVLLNNKCADNQKICCLTANAQAYKKICLFTKKCAGIQKNVSVYTKCASIQKNVLVIKKNCW